MNSPTLFIWDEAKAASNLTKHDISFQAASDIFFDETQLEMNSTRPEFGEDRFRTVGLIQGRLITVVFTMRGEVCRIISARRANSQESKLWET